MLIRLTAHSLAILLTACTQYRYINPQTPEGLDCLKKFDAKVNACETDDREKFVACGGRVEKVE
ncbi:hypothetical protein ACIP02_24430 [Pseudomonas sp. NPDC089408]|uniref:hypothetical protein n=1 Tax=Pseudomonas sp. NPDC089408 TaxID=3364465 RepID=UPI0037F82EF7